MQKILIWDLPVRLGHWLMAGGFMVAWLTSESEQWRLVHAVSGGVVLAVALFRLVWGFMGSRHARFQSFLRGPQAVVQYLNSLIKRQPEHHTGHNPAGGWAIMALLGFGVASGVSGWVAYNDWGGDALKSAHEFLATAMLTVVLVHLAGVISGSWLHRENLVRAMIVGRKLGAVKEAIASPRKWAALALLLWTIAASWLVVSW